MGLTIRKIRDRTALCLIAPYLLNPASLHQARSLAVDEWLRGPYAGEVEDNDSITRLTGDGDLMGGVNPGDRRALYSLVRALKPRRVLEIGTHIALSSFYIAMALKRLNEPSTLTTVDIIDVNAANGPWRKAGCSTPPVDAMRALDCGDHVDFVQADSLPFLTTTSHRFDLIFLDGNHAAPAVYREVAAATRILNPNGLILLHDFYPGGQPLWPNGHVIAGPHLAMQRIMRETAGIMAWPLGALPWPTKQSSHRTSLALVSRL